MNIFMQLDRYLENNRVFARAVNLLAHPIVFGLLCLAFFNDHFLRIYYPSWLTGKLGDFIWLFLAPIPVIAVISWLFPIWANQRKSLALSVGLAVVFVVFVVGKCFLGANELATRILSGALQAPFTTTPDPTDAIALPALLLCFWFWKLASSKKGAFGLVALPLIALLTMANAGMPDPGITCFSLQNQTVFAQAGYSTFSTMDGGMTWQTETMGESRLCQRPITEDEDDWLEIVSQGGKLYYRYQAGKSIEESIDNRNTWNTILEFPPLSEAKKQYYLSSHQGYVKFSPGPLDAIVDPKTSNVIFAMGHQGVLVLQPNGDWAWATVGKYRAYHDFPNVVAFGTLLGTTVYLSIALGLLTLATLSLRWLRGPFRIVILALAWIGWLVVDIIFPPALALNYGTFISGAGIVGVFLLVIPLIIDFILRFYRHNPQTFLLVAGISAVATLLFIFPYVLWLFSTLPTLLWATGFGLPLGLTCLLWGFFVVRKQEGVIPSRKETQG